MLYAGSPLANWRVIFTKLVYYGRMEVIMISDIALLEIYNQYNNCLLYTSDAADE